MLDKRYHAIRNFNDRLRAAQDTIRRVHLRGADATQLLNCHLLNSHKRVGTSANQRGVVHNTERYPVNVGRFGILRLALSPKVKVLLPLGV